MTETIMITSVMAVSLMILSSLGLVLIIIAVASMFTRGPSGRSLYRAMLRKHSEQNWEVANQMRAEWDRRNDHGKFTKINGVYRVHKPTDIRV